VVIRDNRPAAVMMTIETCESLMDELEDLRIETVACDRLATLDESTTLSHADMLAQFGATD
jgi:antitoxin StbD